MRTPENCAWPREHFLKARRKQIAQAKQEPPIRIGGEDIKPIICDPGDDIVCDDCNTEIIPALPFVYVVRKGNRAVCRECLNGNGYRKKAPVHLLVGGLMYIEVEEKDDE